MICIQIILSFLLISFYAGHCESATTGLNFETIGFPYFSIPTKDEFCSEKNITPLLVKLKPLRTGIQTKWIPLILALVLSTISFAFMTCTPLARKFNALPGDMILPLIGSFYVACVPRHKMSETLSNCFKRHGRTLRMWMFHKPTVLIAQADHLQAVLGNRNHLTKTKLYTELEWYFGKGLVTSEGDVWKKDRKLMDPSFKYQRFDGFLVSFNKHSKILVTLLEERFKEETSEAQNLHPMLCLCGMDFILDATLGITTSFQCDTQNDFATGTRLVLEAIRTRIFRPWMKLPIIRHISGWARTERDLLTSTKEHINPIIENRRRLISSGEGLKDETKPFLDSLLNAGKNKDELFFQVATIFGGGFETAANGINYTMFLLAVNPNLQSKVHDELDQIFGSDSNSDVTFNHLAEMQYLEMCIKESMRIFPPIPFMGRVAQSDIKLEKGMTIPKGCDILISIFDLHRDSRVFPDPETFNPDRFLPEVREKISHYAYMPFSVGARNCIGQKYAMMEMKTVLTMILRKFKITTELTRENLKLTYGLALEPAGRGIQLKFVKRNE